MARANCETPGACIYCASTQSRQRVEHVMSKALGTFEHNWTLTCVCDGCNQYFGDTFELALGRDSLEGLLRAETGVKPASSVNSFLNRRAVFSLQEPGDLDGARVIMRVADGVIAPDAAPQVGFRVGEGPWQYFLERDLIPEAIGGLGPGPVQIKVIGRQGGSDLARLVERLSALGIQFTENRRLIDQPMSQGSSVSVVHEFDVDTSLRRAAAKISFNYLAAVLGADIARKGVFDRIRQFIRFGDEPEQLVTVQRRSLLVGFEAADSRTHACMIGWEDERSELVGIVTLFNEVTYGIRLCAGGPDEWASLTVAHTFDPITKRIQPLAMARE